MGSGRYKVSRDHDTTAMCQAVILEYFFLAKPSELVES